LLMKGSSTEIFLAVVTAAIGVILMGIGLAGYLFRPLGLVARGVVSVAGLFLIPPPSTGPWLIANLAGLALGIAFVVWEWQATSIHRHELANQKGKP